MFPLPMASLTPVKASKNAPRSLSFATNTTERTITSPEGSPCSEALSTPLTAHSIESPTFYARFFREMEEEHGSLATSSGQPLHSPSTPTLPTTTSLATGLDPDTLLPLHHSQRESLVSQASQVPSDLQPQTPAPRHTYSKKYVHPEVKRQEELRKSALAARRQARNAVLVGALISTAPLEQAGPSHRVHTPQSMNTQGVVEDSNEASGVSRSSQEALEIEETRVSHAPQVLQDVQAIRDVQAPQDVQVLQVNQLVQTRQNVGSAQEDREETASVQTTINAQAVKPMNTQVPHQFSPQAQPFLPAQPVQQSQPAQPVHPAQPTQPVQPVQPYEDSFLSTRQTAQLLHGLSAIQVQAVPRDHIYSSQRNSLPRIPPRVPPSPHHERHTFAQFEPRKLTPQVKAPGHPQHCQCLACLFPKMMTTPCDPQGFEQRIDNLGCLCPGRGGRLGMQRMVPCFKHDWGARWGWLARGGPWQDGKQRIPARIPEICQRLIDPVVFRNWIESLPCYCEDYKALWNENAVPFRYRIQDHLWLQNGIRCEAWLQRDFAAIGHRYQFQDEFIEAVRETLNHDFKLDLAANVQTAWDDWKQNAGFHFRYALMEPAPARLQNDPQFQVQFANICGEFIASSLWLQTLDCDCAQWRTQWKRLLQMLWDAHPVLPALRIVPSSQLAQAQLKMDWQTRKKYKQELRTTNLAIEETRRQQHTRRQRYGVKIIPALNGSAFGNHQGRFTNIYPYMGQTFGNTEEDPIIENRLNFLGHKSIWRPSVKDDGIGPYIEKPYDRAGSVIWPNTADLLWYGPMWHQGEGGIFGRVLPPVMQRFPPYHAPVPRNGWKVRPLFHRWRDAQGNVQIDLLRNHDENEPVYERYDGLWDESRRGRPIRPDERPFGQSRDGRPVMPVMQTRDGKVKPADEEKNLKLEDPGLDMLPFDALWSEPHYGPRNGLRDPPLDKQADRDRLRRAQERDIRRDEQSSLLPYLVEGLDDPDGMELDDGGVAAEAELEMWKRASGQVGKYRRCGMSYDDNRDGRDIGMGTGYEHGWRKHYETMMEAGNDDDDDDD